MFFLVMRKPRRRRTYTSNKTSLECRSKQVEVTSTEKKKVPWTYMSGKAPLLTGLELSPE